MTRHQLKTWPAPFGAVWSGEKHHEIRVDDRGFAVGDVLELREWIPVDGPRGEARDEYTGRFILALVTYLSPGGSWGLPEKLCVMSIVVVGKSGGGAV